MSASHTCQAGCGRRLFIAYYCLHCDGTFHRNCGKFKKFKDDTNAIVRICSTCLLTPDIHSKYPTLPRTLSITPTQIAKKRKAENSPEISDSESSDDDENTSTPSTEPTLSEVFNYLKNSNRENKRALKSFARTLETATASSTQYLINQEQQNKVNSRVDFRLKAIESNTELMFSGHLEAGNPDANLKLLVSNIATFLKINIKPDDIRKTRLLISKSNSDKASTNPPPIIATLYSTSKRLKLLDASKNIKILNSDVIPNSTSKKQIFVNPVLPKEQFLLLQKCKAWAKVNNFKFVWPHQGEILLKQANGTKTFNINCVEDLNGIVPNPPICTPLSPHSMSFSDSQTNILNPPAINTS